jgi:iron complex outermembrane receptor protein
MRLKPLVLLIATLPMSAAADIPTLDSILVTATKSQPRALNQSGPSMAELARLRAATSDTASLLRELPGVSLYGAGGVSSLPAIRGLADDRLRIKVDGMDLYAACPNHMNPALSYVDPSQVETIKVYAGITPVSVGGDSIGGTILAETRPPLFAPDGQSLTTGEVGAAYRSNGDGRSANLTATHARESASLSYSGALARAGNYTAGKAFKDYDFTGRVGHTLARDEVGSTAYDTRNHTLGMAFKGGNHLVEVKLGYQDLPYQLYPNQRMDMLDNQQKRANLRYLGRYDWGRLEARAYHERVDHFMDFGADKRYWYGPASGGNNPPGGNGTACTPVPSATCAAGMPMYTESETTGFSLKADVHLSPDDLLRVGTELHRYRLDDWWPPSGAGMFPGTFWNIRDGERDRTALFVEWEGKPHTQWTTLLGTRHERVSMDAGDVTGYNPLGGGNQGRDMAIFNALDRSRTDHNWDVTALARYTVDERFDIEFGLARKVRSPGLYETYPWSTWQMAALMNNFVGDGNGYVGTPDLKPEKAHTLSANFDWHAADRAWALKATPYYTRVTDYIDAIQWDAATNAPRAAPQTGQFTTLRYANASARLYGIDVSGRMPLASGPAGDFGIQGVVNYTDGKNRTTGDGLYNIMPLNARLTLTHKLRGWDNAVEWILVKGKDEVSSVRNEIETPGYGLLNLRASHAWKRVRIDFGVENLFDKHYYLPTGGAYVGQGTTMTNPPLPNYPRWGTAVPGPGRSWYTAVHMQF